MRSPSPRESLKKCPTYVQGKSTIAGIKNPIKLSSNESPFGPSPSAKEAYLQALETVHRYPDGGQNALRAAIAERFGIEADQIIGGNGSEELILLAIRAFVDPGDQVIVSDNGFVMTRIHALAQGAEVVVAAEKDWHVNVDNILEAVTPKTKIVAVANPNNPTGTYLPASEIRRLHAGLPSNVLLMLDGAYADYVVADDFESGIGIVHQSANCMMTRTFSKIYGLAGMRVGWAYAAPEIVAAIQKIRTPFNANSPAMAAATAAVRDMGFADMVRDHTITWRERMAARLRELGLMVVPSVTNFLLLQFPEEKGLNALKAAAYLIENGILPRPTGVSGPGDCLRITVGSAEENAIFLQVIERYVGAA
ncbi:histidinol-phosphate transaminase [Govanella unica]|uniref:Histidinol-phosphate aminotransferase n=1 Tax=Govanella unica TaxID=2975056 RepID=A0A9X3TY56_9PROT|nr:histidinol-phosphate transaminase [Govania unica]MDA5193874.1 histidinol-phosphate transaminase [Govania unica]